jgi:hypothetical protein
MFDGKPRVARFLDVRAIRAIALISISFTFLIVVAPPRRAINAAPAPQMDPTRNQLSQSQQSQTKSGYHSHGPMQEMLGTIGLFVIHPKVPQR